MFLLSVSDVVLAPYAEVCPLISSLEPLTVLSGNQTENDMDNATSGGFLFFTLSSLIPSVFSSLCPGSVGERLLTSTYFYFFPPYPQDGQELFCVMPSR